MPETQRTQPVTLTVHTTPCPPLHQPVYDRAIRLLAGLIRKQKKQQANEHTPTVTLQEAA